MLCTNPPSGGSAPSTDGEPVPSTDCKPPAGDQPISPIQAISTSKAQSTKCLEQQTRVEQEQLPTSQCTHGQMFQLCPAPLIPTLHSLSPSEKITTLTLGKPNIPSSFEWTAPPFLKPCGLTSFLTSTLTLITFSLDIMPSKQTPNTLRPLATSTSLSTTLLGWQALQSPS